MTSEELLKRCLSFVEDIHAFRIDTDDESPLLERGMPFNLIDYYGMEDLMRDLREALTRCVPGPRTDGLGNKLADGVSRAAENVQGRDPGMDDRPPEFQWNNP